MRNSSKDDQMKQGEHSPEAESLADSIRNAPPQLKRVATYLIVGAVLIIVGLAVYRHWNVSHEAAEREADLKAGPHVRVTQAVKSKPERALELVGEAKPFASVILYAKVSGYLRAVKIDKGDKVKQGQILAVIESPETNRAYEGAFADAKNKRGIADRMLELKAKNLVSPQEVDQATSDAAISESKLATLAVQKDYEVLRAPFDGTVTARYADPGALVQNATNAQTSALPVVSVSQVDQLRVYTYIDQRDASFVKIGQAVSIHLAERPRLELLAKVSRVTGELDERTKMLLTEIDVDNTAGDLVAGSYVQVRLTVPTDSLVQVPVAAISVRTEKVPKSDDVDHSFVAVVTSDNVISWREVKVADTDGKITRLLSGIEEGTQVALNLGSEIAEGTRVRPLPNAAAAPEKISEHPPTAQPSAAPHEKSSSNAVAPGAAAKAPRDPSSQEVPLEKGH